MTRRKYRYNLMLLCIWTNTVCSWIPMLVFETICSHSTQSGSLSPLENSPFSGQDKKERNNTWSPGDNLNNSTWVSQSGLPEGRKNTIRGSPNTTWPLAKTFLCENKRREDREWTSASVVSLFDRESFRSQSPELINLKYSQKQTNKLREYPNDSQTLKTLDAWRVYFSPQHQLPMERHSQEGTWNRGVPGRRFLSGLRLKFSDKRLKC